MLFVDLCIQGLIQGAIYALIALGLTLVYGLLRILHVAHAALFTLGGYIGVVVTNGSGSFLLALLTAMLIVGIIGMASYRVIYKPLLSRTPLIALIASIGVFIASEELFRIIFGAYGLSYATPPLKGQVELLPGISLSHARILVVVLAVGLLSGVGWLAVHTRIGIAARATVVDPAMAASSGVNVETIRYASFFIGSAFAGAAGYRYADRFSLSASRDNLIYLNSDGSFNRTRVKDTLSAVLAFPHSRILRHHNLLHGETTLLQACQLIIEPPWPCGLGLGRIVILASTEQTLQRPVHLRQGVGLDHEDGHFEIPGLSSQSRLTSQPLANAEHHISLGEILHNTNRPLVATG